MPYARASIGDRGGRYRADTRADPILLTLAPVLHGLHFIVTILTPLEWSRDRGVSTQLAIIKRSTLSPALAGSRAQPRCAAQRGLPHSRPLADADQSGAPLHHRRPSPGGRDVAGSLPVQATAHLRSLSIRIPPCGDRPGPGAAQGDPSPSEGTASKDSYQG